MTDKQQHDPIQIADPKPARDAGDGKKTLDTNSPRTRNSAEQVKVWEEEGGSPPEKISSTKSVKPRTDSKDGSMAPAEK
jgi:hypothetical protein